LEPAAILPVAWADLRHEKPAHALLIISGSLKSEGENRYAIGRRLLGAGLRPAFALERFSQLLQESQPFCRSPQKEVAKIVQCGEPFFSPYPLKPIRHVALGGRSGSGKRIARLLTRD